MLALIVHISSSCYLLNLAILLGFQVILDREISRNRP